jgi:hypothetical protein
LRGAGFAEALGLGGFGRHRLQGGGFQSARQNFPTPKVKED